MKIRPLEPRDRMSIGRIIHSADNFHSKDIRIAEELIDDALGKGESSDYIVHVLEDESGILQGYVCFGQNPLTDHTFDFYWMVIDRALQGRGIGSMLFRHVETEAAERGGKLLMCETSSLEGYGRVVHMYEKLGYRFVARIPNFYRQGDDKLIYMKEL
jgi:ribosomal protein S18 acetylase RimI-like enzyme